MDFIKNNELTAYKGAWMYPVHDGWEANLRGFHYSADTLDALKAKIDVAVETDDPGHTLKLYSADPKYYTTMTESDEAEEGPEWAVQYNLPNSDEYDDNMNGKVVEEVIIVAPDFETAVKYAEQYARAEAHSNDAWKNAEIISLVQK